eukprot:TRINITY_DN1225_c0_g1_i4.p1 TRINITY_DN1225_c0_g1~~TRINITY_DN1225_c0_g1_i4.p1  ORF type:complete len:584 (+),score=89.76 TRINITY_DN1225_c0_g1_i4:230-1753(+)
MPSASSCSFSAVQGSGGGRQTGNSMEVSLEGVELTFDAFPPGGHYASRLAVAIRDIGVYDCGTDAPWSLVLGYHRMPSQPRESNAPAVKVELDAVRPDPWAALEEYRLFLALLPIRLHLDQRHIDLFATFFSPPPPSTPLSSSPPRGTPQSSPPSLDMCALSFDSLDGDAAFLGIDSASIPALYPGAGKDLEAAEEALLPFFQVCEMKAMTIRVDYQPRRIDLVGLRGGNYAELLNLVSWTGIELDLKQVKACGVHGWGALSGILFGAWLEDISQNQVHKFVEGMGPLKSLCAVGKGVAKLVKLPAEHYRRDRRLLRGMRKGATAFLRSVSLEALGLGAQLAAGAQELLQQAENALGGQNPSSGPSHHDASSSSAGTEHHHHHHHHHNHLHSSAKHSVSKPTALPQPVDTREGLHQACERMSQGLERTANALVGNPIKMYQKGAGAGAAMATALRAAPAAAIGVSVHTAGAVHTALLGVRNGLDPEQKREYDEKHAGPPPDCVRKQR